MSESRSRTATLPCSRAWSAGANLRTMSKAASASGTLIRNNASQPTRLTSSPPTTGPTAAAGRVGHLDPAQRPGRGAVCLPGERTDHDDGTRVRRRSPQRHERPGDADEHEVGRKGRQRAGHRHQRHAEHEEPPRPEPVRQPPHQRLARGRGDVEGGDHPGDGGDVEPEIFAQHHQGDGDHRRVQRVQRRAQAEAGHGEAGAGRVAHGNSLAHRALLRRTL